MILGVMAVIHFSRAAPASFGRSLYRKMPGYPTSSGPTYMQLHGSNQGSEIVSSMSKMSKCATKIATA